MHHDLSKILSTLRAKRQFNIEKCVQAKTILLNDYMRQSKLKACIVGVSGGIDSAATLALIWKAAQEKDSPIERIIAVLMPMFVSEGATNQDVALMRGREVADAFNAQAVCVDLSSSHTELKNVVDSAVGIHGDAWAAGQLVSYLRTPALFYLTSLLTQEGFPAIVCGTTNRDEGGYIGYFGKAADGMVDLQLISDLHKSEIFAISEFLGVPDSILSAAPTGDIYDGRTDEQLIGVPYDFIELYTLYLTIKDKDEKKISLIN